MNENTLLDFVELRLSSPSSRCELHISADGQTEKLASGFSKTFLSHVGAAQELFVAGAGPTLRLEGAPVYKESRRPWFTKGTLERFVHYISSPEILESVKTIEDELVQLEQVRSIQAGSLPQVHESLTTNPTVSRPGLMPPEYPVRHHHYSNADNSKRELLRAMDTRLSALQQEQNMAFCRATAAGFDADGIEALLAFSRFFGVDRLRVACNWFYELHSKWQRASDEPVEHRSHEVKNQQYFLHEEMDGGDPQGASHMDDTHRTRGGRTQVRDGSVASNSCSLGDELEAVSPVRRHGHMSKALSQRMSPRRRLASPLKKVQVGRSGSRRAGSVAIHSINYLSERQSRERNQDMDTSSSDSEEDNVKGYVIDEPCPDLRLSPAAARRISVQAAINLFESKQGKEVDDGQGKRSAKSQNRRGSLDGASSSVSGNFDYTQHGEGDYDLNGTGWEERCARPSLDSADRGGARIDPILRSPKDHAKFVPDEFNSEEARHQQGGCLPLGKHVSSQKMPPYLGRDSSISEVSELDSIGGMLEPAESDFSSMKSTITSASHSETYLEKSGVCVDSKLYQSTPTSSNLSASMFEAQDAKSLESYQHASSIGEGPTYCEGKDGIWDCIRPCDLSIQALASLAGCPSVDDEISGTNEGRFYEHYRTLRDAKMEEQQSKRAEREAKLRLMEETLDRRKAEMDARTAELINNGSHTKTRAVKLLALKANPPDMQTAKENGVIRNDAIHVLSTKDGSKSESSPPSPPLTPRVMKEQDLMPKLHRPKKSVATSQKSATTPRSSTRAVSVSPKTTPQGTVGRVSSQRTAASINITESSLACSVPCFSDFKKENTKLSPGKPSGSAHNRSKKGVGYAHPPATSRASLPESYGVIPSESSSNIRTTRVEKKNRTRKTRQSIATGELREIASGPEDNVALVLNTQKDVKIEAPVVTKIRRSAVAPIQEARPFLRKGTGIGPGAGPGVMKLKAEIMKSSDEEAPGTPLKTSDEDFSAVGRNLIDTSDGEIIPVEGTITVNSACSLSLANEEEMVEVQAPAMPNVDATHHSDASLVDIAEDSKDGSSGDDDLFEIERACHTISFPIDFVTHEKYAANRASEPDSAPQRAPPEEGGRKEASATLSQLLSESASQVIPNETLVNGSVSFRANLATEEHNESRFSPMKATILASSSLKRLGAAIPDYCNPSAAALVESSAGSSASWNSPQVQYACETDVTCSQKTTGSSQKPLIVIVPPKEPARGFKRLLKFGRKSRAAREVFVKDGVLASTPSEGDDEIEEANNVHMHFAHDVHRKAKLQERILKDLGIANPNKNNGNMLDKGKGQVSIPLPSLNFELNYDHAPGTSKLKAPRSFFSLSTFRSKGSEGKSR